MANEINIIDPWEKQSGQDIVDPWEQSQQDAAGIGQAQPPQQDGSLFHPSNVGERGLADVLAGAASFSQGIANTPYNLAKTFGASPQTLSKLPQPVNIDWSSYFGVSEPNILDKIVQGGAEYAPAALTGGTSLIPQILSAAGHGFTHAENPLIGGAEGAALGSMGFGGARLTGKTASALFGAGKPSKISEQILKDLGGGKNLEKNALSLAVDVRNAAKSRFNEVKEMYRPVFEAIGDKEITPVNYINNVDESALETTGLKKMNEQFLKNPTFQNAQWLQSQFGHEMRRLVGTDAASIAKKDAYDAAQKHIQNDMTDFLKATDPDLHQQYLSAQKYYAQNYAPYKESNVINEIIKEPKYNNLESPYAAYGKKKLSAQSIVNSLKNPELNANTAKIAGDLSPEAHGKILFSELGRSAYKNPKDLAASLGKLDEKGLSSYVSKDLQDRLANLNRNINYRKYGTLGVAGLAASAATPHWIKHLLGGL